MKNSNIFNDCNYAGGGVLYVQCLQGSKKSDGRCRENHEGGGGKAV